MRNTSSAVDVRELHLDGATTTTTSRFDAALAQLFDARRDYDALRGDAQRVRELSAARFKLDDARREISRVRLSMGI